MKRKAISPLIASVLLIAFTMSVAVLFSPFATNLIQDIQSGTSEKAVDVQRASKLGLEIDSVEFNRSSDELEVVVQNMGEAVNNETNISLGVTGGGIVKNQIYNLDLGSKEIATLRLSVEETYPLETIRVDMTDYPVSEESGIKCTPTKGLYEKIGFGNTEWETSGASVEADFSTAYVGESSVKSFDGSGGEDVKPQNSNFSLKRGSVYWFTKAPKRDDTRRMEMNYNGFSENDQIASLTFESNGNFGASDGSWWSVNSGIEYEHNKWYMFELNWQDDSSRAGGGFYNLSVYNPRDGDIEWNKTNLSYNDDSGSKQVSDGANWQFHRIDDEVWADSIRVYNRSLSQSEIQRLYQVRSESWAVDECKLTG